MSCGFAPVLFSRRRKLQRQEFCFVLDKERKKKGPATGKRASPDLLIHVSSRDGAASIDALYQLLLLSWPSNLSY